MRDIYTWDCHPKCDCKDKNHKHLNDLDMPSPSKKNWLQRILNL